MKSKLKSLVYLLAITLIISCGRQEPATNASKEVKRAVSDSYKAPYFKQDDRKEKIKEIAPELHELILKHASSPYYFRYF